MPKSKQPVFSTAPPGVGHLDYIATNPERLEKLLEEILERHLSDDCYDLMRYMACMSPLQRLAHNLNNVITLLKLRLNRGYTTDISRSILNLLTDGISWEERNVLMEIDASGTSLEVRKTAHSLLDMETRRRFVEYLGGAFIDRRARERNMLIEKPLDATVKTERQQHDK